MNIDDVHFPSRPRAKLKRSGFIPELRLAYLGNSIVKLLAVSYSESSVLWVAVKNKAAKWCLPLLIGEIETT